METTHISDVDFWIKMFKPRTKKWQKDNLKRLRNLVNDNEPQATQNKIKALQTLLK